MPTITLSDSFITGNSGLMARMMSLGAITNNSNLNGLLSWGWNDVYTGGHQRSGVISIMKGSVPANANSITTYSSRSADVLVQWTILGGNFGSTTVSTNPSIIATSFVAAIASGTATWFWWITRGYLGGGWGYNDSIYEQIIGTIGLTGTGADLEIPSTSVTTNQLFRLIDLRMQIATSYSY